jgi:hypothetical protein
MKGRVKAGRWLPFSAQEDCEARVRVEGSRCWGPVTLLRVVDRYANGAGITDVRLFGGVRLSHADDANTTRSAADDANTTRSAAGRAALEAVWLSPHSVFAQRWSDVAGGERRWHRGYLRPATRAPGVHVRIDERVPRTQLLRLLYEANANLYNFEHTLQESRSALIACAEVLELGRSRGYGPSMEFFLREGVPGSDVRLFAQRLETDLESPRITVAPKPDYDPERLKRILARACCLSTASPSWRALKNPDPRPIVNLCCMARTQNHVRAAPLEQTDRAQHLAWRRWRSSSPSPCRRL